MSSGTAAVILFLLVCLGGFIWVWHMTKPDEREDPPGVTITHFDRMGWNYICDDPRAMHGISTGYLTRGSAVRAARAELQRLQERDNKS